MNTYCQQFLEADFTPWTPARVFHSHDIKQSELPALEIPGFDVEKISRLETKVRACTGSFGDNASRDLFKHWWTKDRRHQGWKELTVIPMSNGMEFAHDSQQTVARPQTPVFDDPELHNLVTDVFESRGISLYNLMILKLEPHGWIQPHIDRMIDYPGLSYFWMPLHEFPPCVKIWPWGWLPHRLGCMYLLNHSRYLHAAVNQTNMDRFILSGRIKIDSLPEWLTQHLQQAETHHDALWQRSA